MSTVSDKEKRFKSPFKGKVSQLTVLLIGNEYEFDLYRIKGLTVSTVMINKPKDIERYIERIEVDIVLIDLSLEWFSLDYLTELFKKNLGPLWVAITTETQISHRSVSNFIVNFCSSYVLKPVDYNTLSVVLERCASMKKLRQEKWNGRDTNCLVGVSSTHNEIVRKIERLSRTNLDVIIKGETGLGKRSVARHIHENSIFADGPLLEVNEKNEIRSTISALNVLSLNTLNRFLGGGTFLLHEMDSLDNGTKATFQKLVAKREALYKNYNNSFRVIGTSSREYPVNYNYHGRHPLLSKQCRMIPLYIPPLRQRVSDIPVLVNHILEQVSQQNRLGKKSISEEALAHVAGYCWLGNVTEVIQNVTSAVLNSADEELGVSDFELPDVNELTSLKNLRREKEKEILKLSYIRNNKNVIAMSKELSASKATIYRLLNQHHILGT